MSLTTTSKSVNERNRENLKAEMSACDIGADRWLRRVQKSGPAVNRSHDASQLFQGFVEREMHDDTTLTDQKTWADPS